MPVRSVAAGSKPVFATLLWFQGAGPEPEPHRRPFGAPVRLSTPLCYIVNQDPTDPLEFNTTLTRSRAETLQEAHVGIGIAGKEGRQAGIIIASWLSKGF